MFFIIKFCFLLSILRVVYPVQVTLSKGNTDENVEYAQGSSSIRLTCTVTGGSNPEVTWGYSQTENGAEDFIFYDNQIQSNNARNGRIILEAPYNLKILNLVSTDTGFYTCTGTVPTDSPSRVSRYYNLTVLVPPSVPSCGFPSDLAITLGQKSTFSCYSTGVPDPTYKWFKNGLELPPDPTGIALYSNTSYSYNIYTGTLTISSATEGDAGSYYCSAINKIGQESCTARSITTKNVDVGKIIGIVFGVIFAILLIAAIVWWTWKRGYCETLFEGKEHDIDDSYDDDGANDIVLDGAGPLVHKPPSEFSDKGQKQEASMMI